MVFESLTDSEVMTGRALKQSLFEKIKENFDDLNDRNIGALTEGVFNELGVGLIPNMSTIGMRRVSQNTVVRECIISVIDTFTDSTDLLEADVLVNTTPEIESATSILDIRPTVIATKGTASTNAALTSANLQIPAGRYLFFQMREYQPNVKAFHILLR